VVAGTGRPHRGYFPVSDRRPGRLRRRMKARRTMPRPPCRRRRRCRTDHRARSEVPDRSASLHQQRRGRTPTYADDNDPYPRRSAPPAWRPASRRPPDRRRHRRRDTASAVPVRPEREPAVLRRLSPAHAFHGGIAHPKPHTSGGDVASRHLPASRLSAGVASLASPRKGVDRRRTSGQPHPSKRPRAPG
jgi:hypothetical protein